LLSALPGLLLTALTGLLVLSRLVLVAALLTTLTGLLVLLTRLVLMAALLAALAGLLVLLTATLGRILRAHLVFLLLVPFGAGGRGTARQAGRSVHGVRKWLLFSTNSTNAFAARRWLLKRPIKRAYALFQRFSRPYCPD
jgi:hypothetical protein